MQTTVAEATAAVEEVYNLLVRASTIAHSHVGYWPTTKPYERQNAGLRLLRDLMNSALTQYAKQQNAFAYCDDPSPDCYQCDDCKRCTYHGEPCVNRVVIGQHGRPPGYL